MAPTAGLKIRKLADRSEGEHSRVTRFDPVTGEKYLACPVTGEPKPWPFAGLQIVGEAPESCHLSTKLVSRGIQEGWIETEGLSIVHRSSGPAATPWVTPAHTWAHFDTIVLKTVDGDVRYRVVHQPDKYVDLREKDPASTDHIFPIVDPNGNDLAAVTNELYAAGLTDVHHFYGVELEA